MKNAGLLILTIFLTACNAVNLKPHSLDKSQLFYADRGGYSMKFAVKEELQERGYKIVVGKSTGVTASDAIDLEFANTMNARYVIKVNEKTPEFSPLFCLFNGFYWWKFSVSIADQKTGEELFAWAGRGCANSSIRRLNRLMNELEAETAN